MWYIHIVECYSATKRNGLLTYTGFPGGSMVKYPPTNAGDTGSTPGSHTGQMYGHQAGKGGGVG